MDELEELSQEAAGDPNVRGAFYRVLLDSYLTIPHGNAPEELKIVDGVLQVGTNLKLRPISVEGKDCIPVFSSPEAMARACSQPLPFIRLRGRDFLELVKGVNVALNPGGWGKHLTPDEIDCLLSGGVPGKDKVRRIVTKKPEQILLGQPSKYPTRLVEALKRAFANCPDVKAAYLAHCFIPSQGGSPHTAIGIDAGDYDAVATGIEPAITSALEPNQIVDVISIQEGGAIAEYMLKSTQPFYGSSAQSALAAKPGFWKRLFGG